MVNEGLVRPRFSVAGIPITVEPSFFVIAALLGADSGNVAIIAIWVAVVFVAVLVHELGHACAYRAFGSPAEVHLAGLGGFTQGRALSLGRTVIVSAAGPLAGAALIGLPAMVLLARLDSVSWPVAVALFFAAFAGIGFSVFNLLPVLPLDGGNIVCCVLERILGDRGRRVAHQLSIAIAGSGALAAWRIREQFVALFALFFAGENYRAMKELPPLDS